MIATLPAERSRATTVGHTGLIGSAGGEEFDRLTRLAARLLGVPASYISILDEGREYVLSEYGYVGRFTPGRTQRTRNTVCRKVVTTGDAVIVPDTRADPELASIPVVARGGVAAYAGIPLRLGDGAVVGSFCAVDGKPRRWSRKATYVLEELAASAVTEIELRMARRAADEELRASEARFREIADHVREVFWITDPGFTTVLYASPAYETVWGRTREELYGSGMEFLSAVHPEDIERLSAAFHRIREDLVDGIEFRLIRPDGEVRWVRVRGMPVRDEGGCVVRVVGTTEDITDRMEVENAVRDAERHYRTLVENAPLTIFAVRRDGSLAEINPAGEQALGMEAADLRNRSFRDLVDPEDQERAARSFASVLNGESPRVDLELRIRRPGGDRIQVEVTAAPMRKDGIITGVHGVARDVTREREREQQLRRVERLASLGTLIGGVAHELNNPLQAITNFASLLAGTAASEEEREDLLTIHREALRAARIVSNLRQLARQTQETGRQRAAVDLNDVVRHVIRTRAYSLETSGTEVRLDLAARLPPVPGDRGELEQVLLNLVVNAEQAMEAVTERRLILRTRASAEGITLHVIDSGPGVEPELLNRLFDPFFTTKEPGEGTGLGLSLVHEIVHDHGGVVHAESEPGKGMAFRVDLPAGPGMAAAEAGPPPSAEPRAEPPASAPLRILLVDDEPAVRRALSRYMVRRRGHSVHEACDGAEALRLLDADGATFDIIVSDLRMPGLGGEQLLERLTRLGDDLARRVMFLTGDAASGRAGRLGAPSSTPVIYKPIEMADFATRVEAFARELNGAGS